MLLDSFIDILRIENYRLQKVRFLLFFQKSNETCYYMILPIKITKDKKIFPKDSFHQYFVYLLARTDILNLFMVLKNENRIQFWVNLLIDNFIDVTFKNIERFFSLTISINYQRVDRLSGLWKIWTFWIWLLWSSSLIRKKLLTQQKKNYCRLVYIRDEINKKNIWKNRFHDWCLSAWSLCVTHHLINKFSLELFVILDLVSLMRER